MNGNMACPCQVCGQCHLPVEPHLYDYVQEIDEDLTCHICLQPLVCPVDLPCGHTFCHACLYKHLHIQKTCPVDRKVADFENFTPSSLVLNKVINKLLVRCPPSANCGLTLQRGDLEDHLKHRCPVRNPPLQSRPTQTNNVSVKTGITRLPVLEGEVSHIEIPRLAPTLGIAIVGGSDTALRCIVVQEVFPDGLVAQDGRLKPGDQLVEINGVDMSTATHHQACQALKKLKCQVLRLGVYRERILPYNGPNGSQYETVTVTLERTTQQGFGILTSIHFGEIGCYIEYLVEGSPAAQSHLRTQDKILFINNEDVSNKTKAQISTILQKNEKVTIVVSRKRIPHLVSHSRTNSAPESHDSDSSPSNTTLSQKSASYDSLSEVVSSPVLAPPYNASIYRDCVNELHQKNVTIIKQPNESLGMRIGGGIGSNEGDIPIYIANIHPQSCVGKTQQIWKGDVLLGVNKNSLLGLTHRQAVATLKAATVDSTSVQMSVIAGSETSLGANNFIPSWLYWQKLPRCLQFPKLVVLTRSPGASLGFSIVGGEDPTRGAQHIHILFVVQDSPAAKDGKLKCGDRLLSVDGKSLEKVEHSKAVTMLKQTGTTVQLEIVSWLGTEL